jgi:hypothetical protein
VKNQIFNNLDANESVFFANQLTAIKGRTYDVQYPEFKAKAMIPVSSEAGPGADTILYRQFDSVGLFKLVGNYADDFPVSDVKGKEFSVVVKSIGGSYVYNLQEIRAAQMAGLPLTQRKANACRQAYEQLVNEYGWMADGSATYGGLYGFFFNANTTKAASKNGKAWDGTASADEIIEDVGYAVGRIRTLTKGVEEPNMCIMPPAQYTHISTTPRSTTSDTTILEFLQKAFPNITFDWVNECADVENTEGNRPSGTASGVDVCVIYRRSPDKLTFEIPQPFEQFAPQEKNLSYVVPAHGRIGGVLMYYPLSVYVIEGI